jgi:Na+/H+-dicarboxylate symporter
MKKFPLRFFSFWFSRPLWQQILVGLFAGILTGLFFKTKAMSLEPIGFVFIHAIQLLVAPVVLTSVVCAILSLEGYK